MQITGDTMFLRDPRIRADQAYGVAAAARALGVEPDELDDWMREGSVDLEMFTLPNGHRRVPGSAILRAVSGKLVGKGLA